MFTVNDTDVRQQKARAKAERDRPTAWCELAGAYKVRGSQGGFYRVTVYRDEVECTCFAGQNNTPCYHAFAALRIHEAESAVVQSADTATPARDKNLKHIEDDLRFIMRQAEQIEGNYELVEAIFRAARAAHDSLSEYELELLPATDAAAAA